MFPISHILPRARALFADRLAVWDGERRFTFEELGRRVDALAGALKAKGLGRGDRVGILDVNSHRYAEVYYACAQAGMILLPLNSRLAPPELKYVLNDSGAKALIATESFFPLIEGISSIEVVIKDYEAFLAGGTPDSSVEKVELDDICQIYYTSGTTGEPKGVCLTYRNMIASAFDSIVGLELRRDDIWLHAAPMFHLVDAWSVWSMPMLGATQVMVNFTPEKMMEVVQRAKPTGAGVPPTLINMMANHPRIGQYDLSSLRLIMYGGSPTPLAILQKAAKALPTRYIHGFGITETSGITTLADPNDFYVDGTPEQLALTNNAGRAVPHINLGIMNEQNDLLSRGKVGEVVVSGARVMREYWNKPKHTAEALNNGWYHSGDMGYLDEQSRLFIVDRKKDMIISGGENVYSVEIENVLSMHPAVLEVAVIGVPDDQWGEAVKAVVVLKEGSAASADELIGFCRGMIAGYKLPKSVDFSAEQLPKTGPGKVAKRRLRDPYWAGRERKI
ncbi:MAG: long-chain-fatty-acid--CoA ligase [Betaproteobacteria bacterium]|nr:long-chain-fatty-acid--CoA ligase [Betaproteobacteria bacterium]